MTPKELTIIDYIKDTIIPKIDGEGDYYNTITASRVFKGMIDYRNFREGYYPLIMIADAGDTEYTMINTTLGMSAGGDDLLEGWHLVIVGVINVDYIDYDRGGSYTDELVKLKSDIILAFASDISLGGNVNTAIPLRSLKRPPLEKDDKYGILGVEVVINYDFNPYAASPQT